MSNIKKINDPLDKSPIDKRMVSPVVVEEEQSLDLNLRPRNLDDFVGQEKLKENLKIFITAAKQRK